MKCSWFCLVVDAIAWLAFFATAAGILTGRIVRDWHSIAAEILFLMLALSLLGIGRENNELRK